MLVTDLEQTASRKTWDVGERERPVANDLSYPVTPSPKVPSLRTAAPPTPSSFGDLFTYSTASGNLPAIRSLVEMLNGDDAYARPIARQQAASCAPRKPLVVLPYRSHPQIPKMETAADKA